MIKEQGLSTAPVSQSIDIGEIAIRRWIKHRTCFWFSSSRVSNLPSSTNDIILRCIECDGRSSADDALTTSNLSADENSTVVWAVEMNSNNYLSLSKLLKERNGN